MKKIFLLFLLMQSLICFADIADIQLSMNDNNVVLNDEFFVNLNTSDLNGLGVISYEISVSYENLYLQFMEVIIEGTISEGGFVSSSISNGNVNIAGIFTQNLSGSGYLLKLKFKAIDDGVTSLNYVSALFNTANTTNLTGGNVTIANAPTETMLSVGNYMHAIGEDFEVEILATAIAGKDCISFEFDFSFDASVLEYTGYSTTGTIIENWTVNSIGSENNISFVGINTIPISEDGVFLKLQFHVLEYANDDCNLILENVVLNTIDEVIIENGNFFLDTSVILPPQNVTLSVFNDGLRLSWNEVPNATYYEIYSALIPDAGFEVIQTGTFPQIGMKFYWDFSPSANKGFYKIKACNDN